MSCHDAVGNGLAADEYLPHDRILNPRSDKLAKRYSSSESASTGLLEYSFAADCVAALVWSA